MLSKSEGQILLDIMDEHGLEQMIPFPTREKKNSWTWFFPFYRINFGIVTPQTSLVITTLFQDFKESSFHIYRNLGGRCIHIRKGLWNYEKDYDFAKEKYCNGHSDARSVQKNFNLITSLIHDSVNKHIPSTLVNLSLRFLGSLQR